MRLQLTRVCASSVLAIAVGVLPVYGQVSTAAQSSQSQDDSVPPQAPDSGAASPARGSTEAGLRIPYSTPRGEAVAHRVLPQDTDATIDDALAQHLASVAPCDQPSGYLVLFLPGTGGTATGQSPTQLLNVATQNCLHGISLSYPDSTAVWNDCVRDPDPDCYEKWRLQKLDGVQRSRYLTTTPANSIENRLLKLLGFLARTYPDEGWQTYLGDTGVRWDSVVVTGESQGGGIAALIGHVHLTARVVMFAAITDALGGLNGPSPDWVAKPSATPTVRYFGFAHMRDQWWPAEQKNWAALSLDQFGPIVNVDSAAAPFDGSHMLTSDIPFDHNVPNGAHPTVAAAPNAAIFKGVWEYLLITG
jgi:hypothetical protein